MVSLLLIISFLLHLISIYAIYQLFQQKQALNRNDADELAELFESYLQEIKVENEQLQKNLERNNSAESAVQPEQPKKPGPNHVSLNNQLSDEFQLPEFDSQDHVEASMESKVLQLYSKGLSTSDIAQKLNCGNTEVELIIKLHKKNNPNA